MMRLTAERTGSIFRDNDYLTKLIGLLGPQQKSGVIYVSHEGKRVASALFVDDMQGSTRYYMYAGTGVEARKIGANGTLVSFLILDAAAKGLDKVDLFGVCAPDAAEDHPWYGFSKFKRSYGGEEVDFGGTYEKPINKTRYKVLQIAKNIKK
jgi:lipid II:glycine glycyltransferase (peptidoglycan interpeptide bridge formation enzyme)